MVVWRRLIGADLLHIFMYCLNYDWLLVDLILWSCKFYIRTYYRDIIYKKNYKCIYFIDRDMTSVFHGAAGWLHADINQNSWPPRPSPRLPSSWPMVWLMIWLFHDRDHLGHRGHCVLCWIGGAGICRLSNSLPDSKTMAVLVPSWPHWYTLTLPPCISICRLE
jgi:hypothetical protein